ncbi:hypothetical protein KC319_g22152, partial [Hortaea werneckii]
SATSLSVKLFTSEHEPYARLIASAPPEAQILPSRDAEPMATVEDDERIEELGSLEAIFPELVSDHDSFTASLELAVAPSNPLTVSFLPHATSGQCQFAHSEMVRIEEHKIQLSHLPPLYLQITLPTGYPADTPPQVKLSSKHNWLPKGRLDELSGQAEKEWEEQQIEDLIWGTLLLRAV